MLSPTLPIDPREDAGRSQRVLDTLFSALPVVILGQGGRIRFLTEPACQLLGLEAAGALNRPFSDFVEDFDVQIASIIGNAVDRTWTGRRLDGTEFHLRIQIGVQHAPHTDDHVILSLTDLTAAHEADARARDLHNQLNRVWRLNSLGEMGATLAHELNQPLAAATTYLHVAEGEVERLGTMGQGAWHGIGLAKAQVLRAGEIIRRMRDLLALESRSLGVERAGPLVDDLRGVFAMLERAEGCVIEIDVDDVHDQVRAERIQVQQALLNLVRNAVEATSGRPGATVRIRGRARSDSAYEFRVEDNGPGIPPADVEAIFRPLSTTKSGGMGLGLSVTRTIIESHGGQLALDQSDLGGAAFTFQLTRDGDQGEP